MAGKKISSPNIKESENPYSKAMAAGNFIFVSGLVPRRPDGTLIKDDIRYGVERCMVELKVILEAAGAGLEDLVKVNVHLKNLDDFQVMNEVYRSYFKGDLPARATTQAGRMNAILELEATAYKD